MSAERDSGLRLLATATLGMTLFLLLVGGGLWALSPDLEDGAPPDPRLPDVIEGPKAIGAGAGFGTRRRLNEPESEKAGDASAKTPTAATETPKTAPAQGDK